jgi:malate dehydrogenase (quinone)
MSVPHLDTRVIDGKKELLFGPYAGFSTRFLKNGSYFDLPLSIEIDNIFPMLAAGWNNLPLTKYLVQQVTQSTEDRLQALREYYPEASGKDWELAIAGQRVQVIKKDKESGGKLEFGTEVVHSADGTLAALLGASPGASTSVSIMLDVLQSCFPQQVASEAWTNKLTALIPSYKKSLIEDEQLAAEMRERSKQVLGL